MNPNQFIFAIVACYFTIVSCNDEKVKSPKPHMYPRIVYPSHEYKALDTFMCHFTFQYPKNTTLVKDSFAFEGKPTHDCWFDINSKMLNTSLHCSYYNISEQKNLSKLISEAFDIADKHNVKANFRKETIISNAHGVKGILFDIEGPVASPVQFYLTDEKEHFFRASLYFNSKVNPDSTAPVLKFMKQDIDTLIATFKWK